MLQLASTVELGRGWLAGVRFSFYTGFPAQITDETQYDPIPRAPATHRLDGRIEKRWRGATAGSWWAVVLEVQNATLSKDYVDYTCDEAGCSGSTLGPIVLPSVGIESFVLNHRKVQAVKNWL